MNNEHRSVQRRGAEEWSEDSSAYNAEGMQVLNFVRILMSSDGSELLSGITNKRTPMVQPLVVDSGGAETDVSRN